MNHWSRCATAMLPLLALGLLGAPSHAGPIVRTPQQKACEKAKKWVTQFVEADWRGSRLRAGNPPVPARPLLVAQRYEIVRCVPEEKGTWIRVRYQLRGIVHPPTQGAKASTYQAGKGAADQVFRVVDEGKKTTISDSGSIVPHVSPSVAVEELQKEAETIQDPEEKESLQAAITALQADPH